MGSTKDIVIIDPNPHLLDKMSRMTLQTGFSAICFDDPNTPIYRFEDALPRLALLGPSLDLDTYLKCVHKLRIVDPTLPILIASDIDSYHNIYTDSPHNDLHLVSPELYHGTLTQAIVSALERKKVHKPKYKLPLIIGRSEAVRGLREKLKTLANRDLTVLITGESGTGKELIALYLHHSSIRHKSPLIRVNCAALPDGLLESEIFGFQKGAFTDASHDKPGRIEMAHNGTLFLDEIGDLSLQQQAKILQVLEDKEFSRLGDIKGQIIDARIILATNQDLKKKVRQGRFRKDLYYRLNVINITVPPLRERKDDIDLLVDYFMHKSAYELRKEPVAFPIGVMRHFKDYHWPGNIRELENTVQRIALMGNTDFIFDELHTEKSNQKKDGIVMASCQYNNDGHWSDKKIYDLFRKTNYSLKNTTKTYVTEREREEILKALNETNWNRKKSAKLLKVCYKKLLNRINEFNLEK